MAFKSRMIEINNMNNNQAIYTLPEGWIWTTLDLVSKNITDGSHNPPSKQASGIPMLSARNIENGKITFDEVRYISESDYEYENQRTRIEAGDVLLTIVATIGRSAIISTPIQQRFALQRSVASIKPLINGHFLLYVFQSPEFQKLLTINAKGTAQKGVYLRTLRELPIPLPPLPEQQRIVSRIEELFSELDHAEEGLKKAQKQLKIYWQALLKSAFEGKLTEKWRKESHFKSIEINGSISRQLPNGWIWDNLGNIAKISMGQSPPGDTYNNIGEGIPLINGPVEFNKSPFSKTKKEKWTTQPIRTCKEGDLLICVRGSTTGRQNIAGFDASIGRGVAAIHVTGKITINYLTYFTHFSERKIYEMGTGSTFPSISKEQISSFLIPICTIKEQDQIVQELEMRFTLIENLENSIEDGFLKIRLFRQSILREAFEGKLVLQSKVDEPATTLLKLISLEKEAYILNQKMIVKEKPLRLRKAPMDTNNTIKEILEKAVQPIESRELWLKSKHKDNIEEFYAELKKIEHEIDILIEGKKSSIILKR